ncbi:MAG TPA: hypothetical protein VFZ66_01015 [Herpetosiphonaceae bacterium]
MKLNTRWIRAVPMLASLLLAACGQAPAAKTSKPEPAHVEAIEGTDLSRIVLVPEAARRLDIQTVAVREGQVTRKRTVGGEVVTLLASSGAGGTQAAGTTNVTASSADLWVRVPLSAGDLNEVDRSQPATVLPLDHTNSGAGVIVEPAMPPTSDAKATAESLYYIVKSGAHGLEPGQRVRVELTLAGSARQRMVIPYGAVIYDLHGETWVYTSPESLTYVREGILVDYIDGDMAVLSEGPSTGTQIVTVGAAELYGIEFGVGH